MGIKVLPPDVNESDADFTPGGTEILFGLSADPQRRRQRRRRRSSRRAGRRAASPTSRTSCARCRRSVCNKRVIESLIKAGAFDSLGHARKGLMHGARAGHRRDHRHQEQRGDRPGLPVRRASRTPSDTTFDVQIPAGRVGQDAPCSPSSARCSASTSPTTRSSASSTSSPPAPTARSPRSRTRTPDGQIVTVGGISQRRPAQGHQEGRHLGADHAGGPRGRHRGDDLPLGVPALLDRARRGRHRLRQGPPGQARGRRASSSRWR